MKLAHYPTPVHLSYCTNVHAGDTWEAHFAQLQTHLPPIKARIAHRQPMGIGLRLSEASLETLEQPEALGRFQAFLQAGDYYVFTVNGFPQGSFHGQAVKEQVYRPDWTDPARCDYTQRLATLLTKLDLPEDHATISTLPGTFKPWASGAEPAISRHLLDCVAHCVKLERETGKHIAIALEPEPYCMLETVQEVVDFFSDWLWSGSAIAYLCRRIGTCRRNALVAVRRHLGICYDACHSAVEFEDPNQAIDTLQAARIPIFKLQLSSALRLVQLDEAAVEHLRRFDEPVYLHQVVAAENGELTRYPDLHEALADWEQRCLSASSGALVNGSLALTSTVMPPSPEWRVHFHVPVFREHLNHFGTTQAALIGLLDRQRTQPFCRHLEVETYTWDVLPEGYGENDMGSAIARELSWVAAHL